MSTIQIFKSVYKREVMSRMDKLYNTLSWIFSRPQSIIILNVWLKHRGKKVRTVNLGDDLNYAIISFLSGKKIISYNYSYIPYFRHILNYMCIGSIADTLVNEESVIWGSGAMYGMKDDYKEAPKEIMAVRGPLTRDYFISKGIFCPEVYGDPVLLLPTLYPIKTRVVKYKLGIIPHFVDYDRVNREFLSDIIDNEVIVIDIAHYKRWQDVIDLINQCEVIASSSLHGLIISDAYKIPNVWVKFSANIKGDDFKYRDYFGSVSREILKPLDFSETKLDFASVYEIARLYNGIRFDAKKLIEACPFCSNKNFFYSEDI